jgi:hypothetical protein
VTTKPTPAKDIRVSSTIITRIEGRRDTIKDEESKDI